MRHETGDETADFLLDTMKFLRRVGSPKQKADYEKWRQVILENAEVPTKAAACFAEQEEPTTPPPAGA